MTGKFLFFGGLLLLGARVGFAQAIAVQPAQPFIKLAHVGTGGKPIIDLYLTPSEPKPNPEQGISSRFLFESVCLLTEAEFAALLRYAEGYIPANKPDSKIKAYGTFELTVGPYAAARQVVYTRRKSLAFIQGAVQVLQKQAASPDQSEALRRLQATAHRLSAEAN